MKVCYVVPGLGPGGAEKQLCELVSHLNRADFEPVIINLHRDTTSEWSRNLDARIIGLEYRGAGDLTKVFRIRRIISDEKPDVLHCVLTSANFYGLLASVGTGVSVRIAGERSVGTRFTGLRRAAYPRVLSLADAVVTNSHRNREWMEQTYSMRPGTVRVIHNGCRLPAAASPATLEQKRRALGIAANEFVIATLTHLTPEKDVVCLVRAAARLARSGATFRVVIAGNGPCLDAVRDAIRAHELQSRIVLTGHVSHPEALLIAQLCDAFALTSPFEGMPNALMEAMAFGKPCVASNVGGVPELIEDGHTGLSFEAGDDETLASHLASMMSDLRQRLGRQAYTRIATAFSIERMVQSHQDLYRSLSRAPELSGRFAERLAG